MQRTNRNSLGSFFKETITSRQNNRVKELVKLRERAYRDETKTFIVEGFREVFRAHKAGVSFEALYCCPELFKDPEAHTFLDQAHEQGIHLYGFNKEVFAKVSARQGPDGLLAVARQWPLALNALKLSECPLILIVQGVEKPGNLGSLIRTAEGAGIDALILCDPITDLFNPNTLRNSQGAFFTLPMAEGTTSEVLNLTQQLGIELIATTPDSSTLYWEIDYKKPTAILLGAEHEGLSNFWLEHATMHARIPMHGTADSLNVSSAGSVMLFEAVRQRTQH
jgi:TrmH family RNA methyltransferase